MSDLPPNGLSALEAREKIREGWLSSEELVSACLDRIDQTDGQVKAWAYIDREKALNQARAMDQIRMNGRPMGALHGIPVGLKDIVDTCEMPTERGSTIFKGRQPDDDAFLVNRLKEEGAVILGKTVTTEFAFMNPAETANPHNPEHSPGGSSSGSAAAVAAFHVPLAIGTQTNGSVIRPASYCGTYGFKPTSGVLSRTGLLQTSKTLDQVGIFARDAGDTGLLADAIAAYDPTDVASYSRPRPAMLEGYRSEVPVEPDIVWFDLPFHDRLSADSREAMNEVKSALGERVESLAAPDWFAGLVDIQRIIHEYEICQHMAETFERHWDHVSDTLKPIIERGRTISADQYEDALSVKYKSDEFFDEFFKDYDAILTPSSTGEAPRLDVGNTGDPIFCTIWTLAGLPCINLPILTGENGLPIGVQLVGGREEDARLLRTTRWILNELEL